MDKGIIKKELLANASSTDGKQRIDCAKVMEIAEKLSITPIEAGKICNEMGIKIKNCQLGCF